MARSNGGGSVPKFLPPIGGHSKAAAPQIEDEVAALNRQAMVLCDQGDYAAAREILSGVLPKLGLLDSARTKARLESATVNNLGCLEKRVGNIDAAAVHLERALKLEYQVAEPSPSTVLNLTAVLQAQGSHNKARDMARLCVELLQSAPGDHLATVWVAAWHNLAVAQMHATTRAEPEDTVWGYFAEAARLANRHLGGKHPLAAEVASSFRAAKQAWRRRIRERQQGGDLRARPRRRRKDLAGGALASPAQQVPRGSAPGAAAGRPDAAPRPVRFSPTQAPQVHRAYSPARQPSPLASPLRSHPSGGGAAAAAAAALSAWEPQVQSWWPPAAGSSVQSARDPPQSPGGRAPQQQQRSSPNPLPAVAGAYSPVPRGAAQRDGPGAPQLPPLRALQRQQQQEVGGQPRPPAGPRPQQQLHRPARRTHHPGRPRRSGRGGAEGGPAQHYVRIPAGDGQRERAQHWCRGEGRRRQRHLRLRGTGAVAGHPFRGRC
eukprot:TRINITY_DN8820_c0_g3_i3.p1 TRINITY_DN8820_c0_g3~~TRINITY_DN8820_c0_g3_i3.p1  ORF type:complete len:491 (+),score=72.81 TRINITY_DN8820_c0_g3_i3:97-1569(+)